MLIKIKLCIIEGSLTYMQNIIKANKMEKPITLPHKQWKLWWLLEKGGRVRELGVRIFWGEGWQRKFNKEYGHVYAHIVLRSCDLEIL